MVAKTPTSTNRAPNLRLTTLISVDARIRAPVIAMFAPVLRSSKPNQLAMMGAIATQEPASETMWAISSHQPVCQPRNRPPNRETML